jgi:hypothetical protein
MTNGARETNTLELATRLTIAWLSNPNTRASPDEVSAFLQKMLSTAISLSSSQGAPNRPQSESEFIPVGHSVR